MSTPLPVTAGVIRRGLGILWVAVKEQPKIFTVSAVGSGLFGLMTIAQAYGFLFDDSIAANVRYGFPAPSTR